jgi:hypothetical protein
MSFWCEACRDNFPVRHYDEDRNHKVGAEFGPVGSQMERERRIAEGDGMSDIREAQIEEMARALIKVAGYRESGLDSPLGLTPTFHPITFRQVAALMLKAAIETPTSTRAQEDRRAEG